MSRVIVSGTDTGVGKTVFAAALVGALGAFYWKPIQCGLDGGGDGETVRALVNNAKILPEAYRFATPVSPHEAAVREGVVIDTDALIPADVTPLVIEGAGGLLVPLGRGKLMIDLFARWRLPVVLVARTGLGTINHTLLSLEALRARNIPLLGLAFVGAEMRETQRVIAELASVRALGRLPPLSPLTRETLAAGFAANFHTGDFA